MANSPQQLDGSETLDELAVRIKKAHAQTTKGLAEEIEARREMAQVIREMPFHPLANDFPIIEGKQFEDLVADIKANGLQEPIVFYEDKILDGRNRYLACAIAGIDPEAVDYTGDDPVGYVISANIHRRHLTAEDKRDLIEKLLKAKPQSSDRTIAKQTKVDHKTVGKARSKLEATGEIPQLKKTVGADGKSRSKPKKIPKSVSPPKTDPIGSLPVRYSEAPATSVPRLSPTVHFLINGISSKLKEAEGKLSAHDRTVLFEKICAFFDPDDIVGELVRLVEKMTVSQRRGDFIAQLKEKGLLVGFVPEGSAEVSTEQRRAEHAARDGAVAS
jgi:hypothetical protein